MMLLVVASRAGHFRVPRYEPQAVRPSPKTHGLPEGLVPLWPARRLCRPPAPESGGVRYCRSNERCGSPERSVIPQADSLHVPSEEGWPFASEGPCISQARYAQTRSSRGLRYGQPLPAAQAWTDLTNRRDNRQHIYAGARVAAQVCCDPVVIGPRTSQSVRLAARLGKPGRTEP